MKKIILLFLVLVSVTTTLTAQEISKNAIGIRFGDNDGFGGEISYQKKIEDGRRIEIDLGYRDHKDYDAFKLTGIYQWVWNIDGGFNWCAGVGSWSYNKNDFKDSGSFVLAAGDIGIEYLFDIPLQLSLDFRPEMYFGGDYADFRDGFGPDIALGIRYRF